MATPPPQPFVYPSGISKNEAIDRHADRRAAERYGEVSDETRLRIVRKIRKADRRTFNEQLDIGAVFLKPTAKGRTSWRVTVEGTDYYVIYDAAARRLVTFLPPPSQQAPRGPRIRQ